MRRLWGAARPAGGRRLAYEGSLAVGVSALTTLGTLASRHLPLPLVVVVALTTVVLVPLRLAWPAGALLGAAVIAAATNELGSVLLFVLSLSAGYRMRNLPRAAATFAGVLICQVAGWWLHNDAREWPYLVLTVAGFLISDLLPAIVAQMLGQRRALITAMHERNVYLRDQQVEVADRARARERDRIARELHDSLGNRLTLMALYAGALGTAPEPRNPGAATEPGPDATVGLLRATTATAMDELRQILGILGDPDRPEEADALLSLDGLDNLVDAARSTGARITLTREGLPDTLPSIVEHAAYRTIQEGVTNALRHAHGAPIAVTLRYEPDALIVEVVNGPDHRGGPVDRNPVGRNPVGRNPVGRNPVGRGLIGLAERIRLAGGVLYHGPEPDQGYRIAATLPRQARPPEPRPGPATAFPDPNGDLTDHMRRSRRTQRTWLVVFAVGAVTMLGLCAGGLWFFMRSQTVSPATYDTIALGQPEAQVRALLPDPAAALTDVSGEPPAPAGATCVDYPGGDRSTLLPSGSLVYRFCFRDATLVEKRMFTDDGR